MGLEPEKIGESSQEGEPPELTNQQLLEQAFPGILEDWERLRAAGEWVDENIFEFFLDMDRLANWLLEGVSEQLVGEPHSPRIWRRKARTYLRQKVRRIHRDMRASKEARWQSDIALVLLDMAKASHNTMRSGLSFIPAYLQIVRASIELGKGGVSQSLPPAELLAQLEAAVRNFPPYGQLNVRIAERLPGKMLALFPAMISGDTYDHTPPNLPLAEWLEYCGARNAHDLERQLQEVIGHFLMDSHGLLSESDQDFVESLVRFCRLSFLGSEDPQVRVRANVGPDGEGIPYSIHPNRIAVAVILMLNRLFPHAVASAQRERSHLAQAKLPNLGDISTLIAESIAARQTDEAAKEENSKPRKEWTSTRSFLISLIVTHLHDHLEDVEGFALTWVPPTGKEGRGKAVFRAPFDKEKTRAKVVATAAAKHGDYTDKMISEWMEPDNEWVKNHSQDGQLYWEVELTQEEYEAVYSALEALRQPSESYRSFVRTNYGFPDVPWVIPKATEWTARFQGTRPPSRPYTRGERDQIILAVAGFKEHPNYRLVMEVAKDRLGQPREDGSQRTAEEIEEALSEIEIKFEDDAFKIAHLMVCQERLTGSHSNPLMHDLLPNMVTLIKVQDRYDGARQPNAPKLIGGILGRGVYKWLEDSVLLGPLQKKLQVLMHLGPDFWYSGLSLLGVELFGETQGETAASDTRLQMVRRMLGASVEELYGEMYETTKRMTLVQGGGEGLGLPVSDTSPLVRGFSSEALLLNKPDPWTETLLEETLLRLKKTTSGLPVEKVIDGVRVAEEIARSTMAEYDVEDRDMMIKVQHILECRYADGLAYYYAGHGRQSGKELSDALLSLRAAVKQFMLYLLPDDMGGIRLSGHLSIAFENWEVALAERLNPDVWTEEFLEETVSKLEGIGTLPVESVIQGAHDAEALVNLWTTSGQVENEASTTKVRDRLMASYAIAVAFYYGGFGEKNQRNEVKTACIRLRGVVEKLIGDSLPRDISGINLRERHLMGFATWEKELIEHIMKSQNKTRRTSP